MKNFDKFGVMIDCSRNAVPNLATLKKFIEILERSGVNATRRRKLGSDIDASCGQLRRKYNQEKK